jgi:hypothetical protein
MKCLIALILLIPAPVVAQVASGAPQLRLDGLWTGSYQCPMGVGHAETVRVSQNGPTLTAVKMTGDRCVPAGMVTWEGTLPREAVTSRDLPFTLSVRVTVGNGRTTSTTMGTLIVDSSSHMRLGGGGGVDFTRGASPSAGGSPPTFYAPGSAAPNAPGRQPRPMTRAAPDPGGDAVEQAFLNGMPSVDTVVRRIHEGPNRGFYAFAQDAENGDLVGAFNLLISVFQTTRFVRTRDGSALMRGYQTALQDYSRKRRPGTAYGPLNEELVNYVLDIVPAEVREPYRAKRNEAISAAKAKADKAEAEAEEQRRQAEKRRYPGVRRAAGRPPAAARL